MLGYRLTDRAVRDIESARDWYDRHSTDLGNRFLDAVLLAIRFARETPELCREIQPGIRAQRCKRFPYRVYFAMEPLAIAILAVYHTARAPDRWNDPDRE